MTTKEYPYCKDCSWWVERVDGAWQHVTDRSELGEDDWMCTTPEPDFGASS